MWVVGSNRAAGRRELASGVAPIGVLDVRRDQRPEVSAGSLAGVVVVGVIALAAAVFVARLQQVIGLTLAAACLALITLPFQRWLQRGIGGVASMIVTALGSLVAAITLGYVVLRDLRNQAAAVADLVLARLDAGSTGLLRRSRRSRRCSSTSPSKNGCHACRRSWSSATRVARRSGISSSRCWRW